MRVRGPGNASRPGIDPAQRIGDEPSRGPSPGGRRRPAPCRSGVTRGGATRGHRSGRAAPDGAGPVGRRLRPGGPGQGCRAGWTVPVRRGVLAGPRGEGRRVVLARRGQAGPGGAGVRPWGPDSGPDTRPARYRGRGCGAAWREVRSRTWLGDCQRPGRRSTPARGSRGWPERAPHQTSYTGFDLGFPSAPSNIHSAVDGRKPMAGFHDPATPPPRTPPPWRRRLTLDLVEGSEFWVWRARCAALARWPGTAD